MTSHFKSFSRLVARLSRRQLVTFAAVLAITLIGSLNSPVGWAEVQGLPLGQTVPAPIVLKQGDTITVGENTQVTLNGDSVVVKVTPQQETMTVPVVIDGTTYNIEIIAATSQASSGDDGTPPPFSNILVQINPVDGGTAPEPANGLHTPPNRFVFTLRAASLPSAVADLDSSSPLAAGMFRAALAAMAPIENSQIVPLVLKIPGQGVLTRWNPASTQWEAVPTFKNSDNTVTAIVSEVTTDTLFQLLLPDQTTGALDFDVPDGHFFSQANGFGGAGGTGYAVVDDESASFWSEFNRLGGTERVGYPVTGRFMHKGFLTQAFQKMALQWRPELNAALPVNVLDDLNGSGVDRFLDIFRQVPPPADTSADTGLSWDQVVSRHVAMLDSYPAAKEFYLSTPNWLETYGLPLSVKDYGPFVAIRSQRATLQLWNEDVPWAKEGTVVVGNGGDLAKESGLWPLQATSPSKK